MYDHIYKSLWCVTSKYYKRRSNNSKVTSCESVVQLRASLVIIHNILQFHIHTRMKLFLVSSIFVTKTWKISLKRRHHSSSYNNQLSFFFFIFVERCSYCTSWCCLCGCLGWLGRRWRRWWRGRVHVARAAVGEVGANLADCRRPIQLV